MLIRTSPFALFSLLLVMAGCAVPSAPQGDGGTNGMDDGNGLDNGDDMDNGDGLDDGDGMDTGDGMDNGDGGVTGDVTNGQALVEQNCQLCHGADGASGFAPNIQGASQEDITAMIGGGGGHQVYELSPQEILDVEAYLGSF